MSITGSGLSRYREAPSLWDPVIPKRYPGTTGFASKANWTIAASASIDMPGKAPKNALSRPFPFRIADD